MINENLMVNSKTDILEFKRKHNLLVGKGTIKTTVSNIKQLTNADIENLSCGDVVLKEDESGKHAYLVSFKSDTGLCLTYCDASVIETQSYDKVGDNWQYNSEDKSGDLINDVKPIYWHSCTLKRATVDTLIYYYDFIIINNDETPFTLDSFLEWLSSNPNAEIKIVQGYNNIAGSNLVSHFKLSESPNAIDTYYVNLTTGVVSFQTQGITAEQGVTFSDNGVNKIN